MGTPVWEQCKEPGIVMLTINDKGDIRTLPACQTCWEECKSTGVEIIEVNPIPKEENELNGDHERQAG